MGFVNSVPLWLGLAAVGLALPILVHLIRRIRRIQWGAMAVLERAMRKRKRRIRMEDLLVLVLRCLALVLAALALMRPTLLSRAGAWLFGSQGTGMVIAIDASYSMGHGTVTTRFEQAKKIALGLASTLEPGDPLAVVLLGNTPRTILQKTGYEEKHLERILTKAATLPEPLNLDAAIEELHRATASLESPVRECHIITDAQENTWRSIGGKASRLLQEMSTDTEKQRRRCYVLRVPVEHANNVALTRLDYAGGTLRKDGTASFAAQIVNTGPHPAARVTVGLDVNDHNVDTRVVGSIPPGQTRVARFSVPFSRSGAHRLVATLTGEDSLAADDTRFALAHVPDDVRVLCVESGQFSGEHDESETYFLRKALVLKGVRAAIGLHVDTITPAELETRHVREADVVILANVADLGSDIGPALSEKVRSGGGLMIFAGRNIDPARMNDLLGAEHALLPAELLETRETADALALEIADPAHPVGAALADLPVDLVAASRFNGYLAVRPLDDARVILNLSDGAPLLMERPIGLGSVILFTSTADRTWNDLPVSPVYPIWLHTVVSRVTGAGVKAFEVGQALRLSTDARRAGPTATISLPSGETRLGNVQKEKDRALVDGGIAGEPGFYEMSLLEQGSPLLLAANVDPVESHVAVLDDDSLASAVEGTGVDVLAAGTDPAATIRQQRVGYEIWRVLLALGLVAMVAQSVLSDRFSKGMVVGKK